jgi:hypothetical protein
MKYILPALLMMSILGMSGCATLTEDSMTPIALSLSNGANGECTLSNKRGVWTTDVANTVYVRKSDDVLKYDCTDQKGHNAKGMIPSTMGAKIIASAVFLDLGITDAITDKHRHYPDSFVVPIKH